MEILATDEATATIQITYKELDVIGPAVAAAAAGIFVGITEEEQDLATRLLVQLTLAMPEDRF